MTPDCAAVCCLNGDISHSAGRGAGAEWNIASCELYICELGRAMPKLRLVLAK